MSTNPLLQSHGTGEEMSLVLTKIDKILKESSNSSDGNTKNLSLESQVESVQTDINHLKQSLVKKAFEINKELKDSLLVHSHKEADKNKGKIEDSMSKSFSERREDLFNLLMEVQDESNEKQIEVVKGYLKLNSKDTKDSATDGAGGKGNGVSFLKDPRGDEMLNRFLQGMERYSFGGIELLIVGFLRGMERYSGGD